MPVNVYGLESAPIPCGMGHGGGLTLRFIDNEPSQFAIFEIGG